MPAYTKNPIRARYGFVTLEFSHANPFKSILQLSTAIVRMDEVLARVLQLEWLQDAGNRDVADLVEKLVRDYDQGHLFSDWPASPSKDAEKVSMLQQLQRLDQQYPQGLTHYLDNAKKLLQRSQSGHSPFDAFVPKVPKAVKVPFASQRFFEAEAAGKEEFRHCGVVLVAGGLGERLGYSGIKLELPTELTTLCGYLELYANTILAISKHAEKPVPLAIMTSEDTHAGTVRLLQENGNFGLAEGQVVLMQQEKVASLADNSAHIAKETAFNVLTKPHGHGDVHLLLYQTGLARKWLEEGRRWVLFFQDSNAVAWRTLIPALGVSAKEELEVNVVAVPRKAKQAAGAIMRLVPKEEGSGEKEVTANVEYNYVDDLLRKNGFKDGDVNAADGCSPFPGNTNQLIFALEPYVKSIESNGGVIAEFVNPKYADESRQVFKKPTRLECMMQDYPLLLKDRPGPPARIGVTVFGDYDLFKSRTHRLYCPTKNNLSDAVLKAAKGIPDASAATSEMTIYATNCCLLRALGAHVEDPKEVTFKGMSHKEWAHVVMTPRFLARGVTASFPTPAELVISQRSTLVLDGRNITLKKLKLDGYLIIKAVDQAFVTLENVSVENGAPVFKETSEDETVETLRMRGFTFAQPKPEPCVLEYNQPGVYTVTYSFTSSASSL